jgi:putative hydrolases of HD superfamily
LTRLEQQIAFVLELDRLKHVLRENPLADGSRRENTAEHSWHLAMMATVLAEHAEAPVDVGRVVQMLLLHDVVEIDAGDTFVYLAADATVRAQQEQREQAAADRIFGLLPAEQGERLRATWDEFEAALTPEARFAKAVDRLAPMLLNEASGGGSWKRLGIDPAQTHRLIDAQMTKGSTALTAYSHRLIDAAVAAGMYQRD